MAARRVALVCALALALLRCSPSRPTSDAVADSADGAEAAAPDDADASVADVLSDTGLPPYTPPVELGRHAVEIVETRKVVDGPGLPSNITPDASNNNVDVVRHRGRVYMAWRTSADHFASSATRIHVVSSTDELSWRFEQTLSLDRDLREPRFLPIGTSLFLYVARLGTNALSFDPQGISVTELRADGTWSALEEVYQPGFILWRGRVERGRTLAIGYFGGEHIYRFDGLPLEVRMLETDDGRSFRPFDPTRPVTLMGGSSEADFTMNPDTGELFAVARNEAGDETGFGSQVCRASAATPAQWRCRIDRRKFDSPLMFWHDGEAYLIGRRHLSPTGFYDLMRGGDLTRRAVDNQLDYTRWPKRCSLWRYVQSEDRIAYVMDLPSRGDTCFAAILPLAAAGEFAVYDYSSAIDGPDVGWRQGQMGRTYIYRHHLRFTPRM